MHFIGSTIFTSFFGANQMQLQSKENALSAPTVAKKLGISLVTVGNWIESGVTARDGSRVKLKAFRVGRWRYVHPEDLEEFNSRLNAAPAEA